VLIELRAEDLNALEWCLPAAGSQRRTQPNFHRRELQFEKTGGSMPTSTVGLKDRLARRREIEIEVIGRKSGRRISIPVWFVLEGDQLYLLPVKGSDSQWYKNVLDSPRIRIAVDGAAGEFDAKPVTDPKVVSSVVEKFRKKYGSKDVSSYYSKFDVAVIVKID
jgi:deazaflavin-dependent oxidoreductase (nitroreductase family)